MDIFFSTGEKSGEVLAVKIFGEIKKQLPYFPSAVSVSGGKMLTRQGIKPLENFAEFYTVGIDSKVYKKWNNIFQVVVTELSKSPPNVLVSITHHIFNIPLARSFPARVHKVLVGPPEIWAWKLKPTWKCVLSLFCILPNMWIVLKKALFPSKAKKLDLTTVINTFLNRSELSLKNYDSVICLTPLNLKSYTELKRKLGCKTNLIFSGHPACQYNRNDLKDEICSFRETMSIPENHHILSIFPGSRKDTISRLLPIMIKVISKFQKKFHNFHCCVSIADINFEDFVNETISSLVPKSERSSFSTAMDSSNVLLAASSYALLSSGTITLEAACFGVPGAIIYDLNKFTKRLGAKVVQRNQLGNKNRCLTPFGLPNAILADMDFPPEDRPYKEFVLDEDVLNPDNIVSHINNELGDLLEQGYSLSDPPKLDDSIVKTVRDAISPPGNKSPQEIIAEIITDSLLNRTNTEIAFT